MLFEISGSAPDIGCVSGSFDDCASEGETLEAVFSSGKAELLGVPGTNDGRTLGGGTLVGDSLFDVFVSALSKPKVSSPSVGSIGMSSLGVSSSLCSPMVDNGSRSVPLLGNG